MNKKKRKTKKIKKIPENKSKKDRIAEVVDVFLNLRKNGLTQHNPDINYFKGICNTYIEDGNSKQGKVKIHGTKRVIEYILPKYSNNRISIVLRYDKHV